MPLRRLRLGSISFDPYDNGDPDESEFGDEITQSDSPEVQWAAFLTAVPGLEELYLGDQNITPQQLGWFASLLPQLRLLVVKIVPLDDFNSLPDRDGNTQPIIIRSSSFFTSPEAATYCEDRTMEDRINNIARYIYSLWLNATCEYMSYFKDDREAPLNPYIRINEAMESLRSKGADDARELSQ
ncbi:hypothetical protein FRC07_011921 [Ceratobasidium sp. 392]|nr:hypothetical protein FRC07_011921 [Ceratobasidium sp. 392]